MGSTRGAGVSPVDIASVFCMQNPDDVRKDTGTYRRGPVIARRKFQKATSVDRTETDRLGQVQPRPSILP